MANRKEQVKRLLLLIAAAWIGGAAFAQTIPRSDHPPIDSRDRRIEAGRLTESVSPSGPSAAVTPVQRQNFIDEMIFSKMEADRVPHAPLADDAAFFRRVHLDLTGRIPDGEEARKFGSSDDPAKRDKLIDKLVGGQGWQEQWTHYLLDQWRASQNRIGWAGRNLFHDYITDALQLNQPFDELVREMLTANARSNWYVGPSSYLVRWAVFGDNCTEIMHEDTADDMTVHMFKDFMGINLQCVSCHDGANHLEQMNVWLTERKRREFWAQSAFFGKTRVLRRVEERNTQDEYLIDEKERTGYSAAAPSTVRAPRLSEGMVEPAFILTGEKPNPNGPLRHEMARMFTSHPQFARATVNRFWAEMMGVGIVDPVDGFDLSRIDPNEPVPEGWDVQPSHPELLEALAEDFVKSGYDLQHLFKVIAKSSAYQLSSSFPGEWKDSYSKYFARKFVRRLSAEQVYDAVVKATDMPTPIQIPRTDTKVDYLAQTRGPADPRAAKNLNRAFKKDLQFFLESFGQANREFNEPSRDGSILQAALMMNSPIIKSKVQPKEGSFLARLLKEELGEEQFVDRIFWRFLTRRPDNDEREQALTLLAERGRRDGGEDLQWILTNKVDFLFNY